MSDEPSDESLNTCLTVLKYIDGYSLEELKQTGRFNLIIGLLHSIGLKYWRNKKRLQSNPLQAAQSNPLLADPSSEQSDTSPTNPNIRSKGLSVRKKRRTHFESNNIIDGESARSALVLQSGVVDTFDKIRHCYVCKAKNVKPHEFYHKMCQVCGIYNLVKRNQTVDLTGKIAIVTGARIKIGFETALKLLRANATVIVTSRFVADAKRRFALETDYSSFNSRLVICKLDLCSIKSVEEFIAYIKANYVHLDILINNAAQTLHKPDEFFAAEMKLDAMESKLESKSTESKSTDASNQPEPTEKESAVKIAAESSTATQITKYIDEYGQLADIRRVNSWILHPTDVPTVECVEVHIINSIAPFVLIKSLTPLLASSDNKKCSHICNVSSMEGSFNKAYKSSAHVHTNMAKASLNMITRTIGTHYTTNYNILVNSIDTGWIDDMTPIHFPKITPPLDVIDGAARILAPIFDYYTSGLSYTGCFLKDYKPGSW